jgi:hypothetical protein
MASRCFPILNRDVEYSSDYTKSIKQSTLFKTTMNSIKGDQDTFDKYVKYEENFRVARKQNGGGGTGSGILVSASNHELLLDMIRGKHYTNPILSGISGSKYQSWEGVFITNDLSGMTILHDMSWNDISGTLYHTHKTNTMLFPPPSQMTTDTWNHNAYPGMILDPSKQLLYTADYSHYDGNELMPSIKNTGKIDYQWTNAYWKAVSRQQLHGMSFNERVLFHIQQTDVSLPDALRFAPRSVQDAGSSTIQGDHQLQTWCQGKFALI